MIANADGKTIPAICTHLATVAARRVYDTTAPSGTALPYIVVQLQSDFTDRNRVGTPGATALLTIRAYARTLPEARTVREAAHARMMTLAIHGVQATHERTLSLPYDGVAHAAANMYRVRAE